tara:strand:- start:10 stop:255 length:246 start_codon:yes stop_codon:yes gene_type:complete
MNVVWVVMRMNIIAGVGGVVMLGTPKGVMSFRIHYPDLMNLITTDCYAPNVIKKHLMLLIRVQWINGLETRVFQLTIPFGK